MSQSVTTIADEILELFDEITEASDAAAIMSRVTKVREQLKGNRPSIVIKQVFTRNIPEADHGFYDLEDFLAALQRRMGRTYGWRVDYIKATEVTEGVRKVRNEDIQRWQQTRKVPDWAFLQIPQLSFQKRKGESGPAWSTEEYKFVTDLVLVNPKMPNIEIAEKCKEQFGRHIGDNHVKGAIDRLRKKGLLPKKRKDMVTPSKKEN